MAGTNINRVIITGNLTRDPELRSTSTSSVCSMRIACNGRRKNNVMDSMAQLLASDEDVKIAAAYFAEHPSPLATAATDSK